MARSPYKYIHAIAPTTPAVSSPGHGQEQLTSELGYAQRVRSPDSDGIPLYSLGLGRKSTTSFTSRSVTPRRGITSWVAANCATSICAAGTGAVRYCVTTSYTLCLFVIKSRACHITFPRVFVAIGVEYSLFYYLLVVLH